MMLARVAENLYWMARNLERAENTARLINSTTYVLLDLPHGATFGWKNLAEIAGLDDLFARIYPEANEESIMRFLIEDERNPSSIFACVRYARENTRTLREVLPAAMWERINSLYLYVRQHAQAACSNRRERYMVLNEVIQQRHAIVGLFSGTMPHDDVYQLIKLGRNIERADMTTRILDLHSAISFPNDSVVREALVERIWMSTLDSLSAYQTYRRLVSMHVRSNDAIRFLLQDMRFPRSVSHCLSEMEAGFRLMPKSQQLQQLTALLRLKIAQHDSDDLDAVALHEYLDLLQMQLGEIHDALTQNYFHAWQGAVPQTIQTQEEAGFAQQ
ncbi:MAG: alpha-E domain-containing protein [Gammaproteobacteria bacterium]|nr:alpha-E domain-containing protein [Gammaproteobacteria bacterium]MBU1447832.1 alpha-E domain-containing protein [Gammaproteobacteria bacterium]